MYLGSINAENPPKLGDEISVDGNKVGQIINLCKKDDGLYRILFEIIIEKLTSDLTLHNRTIIIKEIT